MRKYLVRFTTISGDYDKEWCHANNPIEAAEIIKDDHWDIKSIDYVDEL